MRRILFVCMGNICRSPTAEGVMRRLLRDSGLDVEIESAGTGGWHVGEPPDERARELGLTPKVRIVASAVAAIRPEIMGLGPIPAVKAVLEQAGMTIDDIDVVELNEAFAAQVVPCMDELGIDGDKLNPFGGAIALGHPFGMTGARIMTTLLNGLKATDGTYGLETMCVAGGMGQAMIVERL